MTVFQPRPLAVPNMRTDYSAENQAFANLGQTLGNLPGDIRKEQLQQQKQQLLGQIAAGGSDYDKIGRSLLALGDTTGGVALLGLGQKTADRNFDRQNVFGLSGPNTPASSPVTPATPENLAPLFTQAQAKYGLPDGYLPQVAQIESSNNPNAQNPNSSAGGLFQFIDSTAKQYGLSNKFDPAASTDAAARLASDNKQALSQVLGRDPTAGELYLAHQQGAGGAAKLLSNPDARAVDVVGADAVRLNGGNADMTAGQFASKWTGKLDGGKPVQMAQAQTGVNDPRADATPSTGAPAQFYVPGTDPQAATQSILSDPKVVEWQRRAALARTESGQKFAERGLQMAIEDAKTRIDTGGPLARQKAQLDIQKSQRDLEGKGFRSLITPDDRAQYGVDPAYKGTVQVDRDNQLHYPGKPATEVTLNSGEKTYDQTVGKAQGEYFVATQQGGRDARDQITTLKRMQSLIDDPNFYSGWNGGRATAFKKLAVSLGIKDAEAAAPNELFEKLSKQAVLDKSGGSFGTGFSNGDREYIDATTANPNNTPEGNRQILDASIKIAQRRVEVSKMARDYAKNNNGRLDGGFDDLVADYAEKNPLFPQAPAASQPQAGPGQQPPPATAAPRRGELLDGYRFKGGDPSKPESWHKVN